MFNICKQHTLDTEEVQEVNLIEEVRREKTIM